MDSSRQEKVRRFEEVLELLLKPDLDRAIDGRKKVSEELKALLCLQREIRDLQEKSVTSVNLGSEADVPDTQQILMNIGLGILVELTLSQALNFIDLKKEDLTRNIMHYTWLIQFIEGQMKLVLSSILVECPYFKSKNSFKCQLYPSESHKTEEGDPEYYNHFCSYEGHEVDSPFAEHEDNPTDNILDEFMFGKTSEKMNSEARPSISRAFKGIRIRRHLNFDKQYSHAKNSSQASVHLVHDDFNQNSSNKKRMENAGESKFSKPCTCRKSRCLQRYCKCFATGKHCKETCSCLECLNKPIHQDIILARRKQIESENPLAFAPKVIGSSDSVTEIGESGKTPALAQDRWGCKCRRSNCRNKHCECCKDRVGCSISCICEGCENPFGRKDVL